MKIARTSSTLGIIRSRSRRFNVDIMILYISGRDQARKLKFNSYVYLPSVNKMFQYRYALMILGGVGEVIIFEHGCYISSFAHNYKGVNMKQLHSSSMSKHNL